MDMCVGPSPNTTVEDWGPTALLHSLSIVLSLRPPKLFQTHLGFTIEQPFYLPFHNDAASEHTKKVEVTSWEVLDFLPSNIRIKISLCSFFPASFLFHWVKWLKSPRWFKYSCILNLSEFSPSHPSNPYLLPFLNSTSVSYSVINSLIFIFIVSTNFSF